MHGGWEMREGTTKERMDVLRGGRIHGGCMDTWGGKSLMIGGGEASQAGTDAVRDDAIKINM